MNKLSRLALGISLLSSITAFADEAPSNAELFKMLKEQQNVINNLRAELQQAHKSVSNTNAVRSEQADANNAVLNANEPEAVSTPSYSSKIKSWDGFYSGLSANYIDGKLKGDTPVLDDAGISKPNPKGVMLEGFAGWNTQFSNNVVLGAEGSLAVGDVSNEQSMSSANGLIGSGVFAKISARSEIAAMAKAKIKLGYAINRFLPYVTVGGVAARTKYSGDITIIGVGGGPFPLSINLGDSTEKTVYGWTVGTGLDYRIGENGFLRASYDYTDLNSARYLKFGGLGNIDLGKKAFDLHEFKLGVGYSF